jgi:hypothetical protein
MLGVEETGMLDTGQYVFINIGQCLLGREHGLSNYIDTKAKCGHLKKLPCKGTLRQVFIRIYRLVIQSVMSVFSTQLCELLSL